MPVPMIHHFDLAKVKKRAYCTVMNLGTDPDPVPNPDPGFW
jgi:hypothetical protein